MSQSNMVSQAHVEVDEAKWKTTYATVTRGVAIRPPGRRRAQIANATEVTFGVTLGPLMAPKTNCRVLTVAAQSSRKLCANPAKTLRRTQELR